MIPDGSLQVCTACGDRGTGNYCSRCGQPFTVKRITAASLLHDVFHLFTHLDKGFGFTLKNLITQPGTMQRRYIAGDRISHQKPFSMFFICATVAGLSRYWLNLALLRYYGAGNMAEGEFFHQYMVVLHIALLPVYSAIVFLTFRSARYNYGEIVVLMLYLVSFFFLAVSVIGLLKFIWPHMDTAYVELPLLAVYNLVTCVHFFTGPPRWLVALKSFLIMVLMFLLAHYLEKALIELLY